MAKNILTKGTVLYGTALGTLATAMAENTNNATSSAFGLNSSTKIAGVNRDKGFVEIVLGLINNLLGILGIVAVLIIIYSGVQLILSQGNEDALKKAKKTLMLAAVGFALIVLSWSIVGFILNVLGGATITTP